MKTIVLTSLLGLSLTACSDEADIGIDSTPITCQPTATGGMNGSVDYNGTNYDFTNASPSLVKDANGGISMLSLWSSQNPDTQRGNYLRFFFGCGAATAASYDVVEASNNVPLVCPNQVTAAVLGSIELLPATDGVLIVDDNTSCFAGRFRVDLGNDRGDGALAGWFSVPLQ